MRRRPEKSWAARTRTDDTAGSCYAVKPAVVSLAKRRFATTNRAETSRLVVVVAAALVVWLLPVPSPPQLPLSVPPWLGPLSLAYELVLGLALSPSFALVAEGLVAPINELVAVAFVFAVPAAAVVPVPWPLVAVLPD